MFKYLAASNLRFSVSVNCALQKDCKTAGADNDASKHLYRVISRVQECTLRGFSVVSQQHYAADPKDAVPISNTVGTFQMETKRKNARVLIFKRKLNTLGGRN